MPRSPSPTSRSNSVSSSRTEMSASATDSRARRIGSSAGSVPDAAGSLGRRGDRRGLGGGDRGRPGRRGGRRVQGGEQVVVDRQDAQRAARHVQRGEEVAGPDAAPPRCRGRAGSRRGRVGHDGQFHRRGRAEAVDQHAPPAARRRRRGRRAIADTSRSTTSRAGRRPARSTPGSPWMPRPHSISSASSRKPGCPAAGTVHGLSARPIVPTVSATRCARRATSASGCPASAARAGDLVHQHRAGQATPAGARPGGQRHVVGDHHHRDVDALGAGQLRGQPEVEPVAGVVLHDQQHPAGRGDRADRVQHRVHRRRREDLAGDRAGQHAGADVPGVGRLVPRAAAGEQRHVTGRADRLDVAADRRRRAGQPGDAGVGEGQSVQGLADHVVGRVDELLHAVIFPRPRAVRGRGGRRDTVTAWAAASVASDAGDTPTVCADTCPAPAGRPRRLRCPSRQCRRPHRPASRRTVDGFVMNLEALLSDRLAAALGAVAGTAVDPVVRRSQHADFQSGAALPLARPAGPAAARHRRRGARPGRPGRGRDGRGVRAGLPQPDRGRRAASPPRRTSRGRRAPRRAADRRAADRS